MWTNPNTSVYTNRTQINVTVHENPLINVSKTYMDDYVGDGLTKEIGSFIVYSIGNYDVLNVSMNATGFPSGVSFTFFPSNISNLSVGGNMTIHVNVSVAYGQTPGTYSGIINVSGENDRYKTINVNITVPVDTTLTISVKPNYHSSDNITMHINDTFNISVNVTNIGNATGRFSNITFSLPSGWVVQPQNYSCGNVTPFSSCTAFFNVTIPNGTEEGNYSIDAIVTWVNPNMSVYTNTSFLNITVNPNPVINLSLKFMNATVGDGKNREIGNFTIYSVGNYYLNEISIKDYGFPSGITLTFTPGTISNLSVGDNYTVVVNVSIQKSYPPGTYSGYINVSTENNGFKTIDVNITVPVNRTWDMSPTYCEKAENPDVGSVCMVKVNNRGNTNINFSITPSSGNYTEVNVTNFIVESGNSYAFLVTYNVSGTEKKYYYSNYTVDALESESEPDNQTLVIVLVPYVLPIINISITPNFTEQGENVTIYINVTDRSGIGINYTYINITKPDGISHMAYLNLTNSFGNLYTFNITYPWNWSDYTCNTTVRGYYNISVFTEDNTGVNNTDESSFGIYAKPVITLVPKNSKYYQNNIGTLFFKASDMNGDALGYTNTTIYIYDPAGNLTWVNTYTADGNGKILPMPNFDIPSDAALGTYTIFSNFTCYDSVVSHTINSNTSATFIVESTAAGGIIAEIKTEVVWYPSNEMTFIINVYDDKYSPIEPDNMTLTVYVGSPLLNNIYLTANMNSSILQRINYSNGTGFYYVLTYVMPANTASGDYWAILEASKDQFYTITREPFRVSQGGPYDIYINLLEEEVYRSDYLDFELILENKGEVGQDVVVDYWVTGPDNKTWYWKNLTIYTPPFSNTTTTLSAYIYGEQSLGLHMLTVRATFSTVQPPVSASTTFSVIAKPEVVIPPKPPAPPAPSPPTLPQPPPEIYNLTISEYPQEIHVVRGWEDVFHVKVNNTGNTPIDIN
ncbi:MAG: hypothetical protein DRG31_06965, partial [Deltaproteobacteria bacterium]